MVSEVTSCGRSLVSGVEGVVDVSTIWANVWILLNFVGGSIREEHSVPSGVLSVCCFLLSSILTVVSLHNDFVRGRKILLRYHSGEWLEIGTSVPLVSYQVWICEVEGI